MLYRRNEPQQQPNSLGCDLPCFNLSEKGVSNMPDQKNYQKLSPHELNRWMEQKRSFYLIDTLVDDHFQRVHLPFAVNACVFEAIFMDNIQKIIHDKSLPIVVYGFSSRSMDAVCAAGKLIDHGYKDVHVLEGGVSAWRDLKMPLEGQSTGAPDDPETFLSLENGSYRVDTEQSTIMWWGRNPNTTHYGNIQIAEGELTVSDGNIEGGVIIDMDSISNIDLQGNELQPILISHLKSDDFFLTKLFPKAEFIISHAKPVEKPYLSTPNYHVSGSLNIRGFSAEQDFMATIAQAPEKGLIAEAHFDIDRTRWDVIYGSARFFEHLGMHLVYDIISFQVRLIAD